MPEKKKTKAKNEPVIYLGPALPGISGSGRVFSNGLTPQFEAAVAQLPALKMLLVKTSGVVEAQKELKDSTSARGVCYRKAVEYAKSRGEKT